MNLIQLPKEWRALDYKDLTDAVRAAWHDAHPNGYLSRTQLKKLVHHVRQQLDKENR